MAERSAETESMREQLLAVETGGDSVRELDTSKIKSCNRCGILQTPSREKMKFCDRCKRACYCSKECQCADWGDHQLECQAGSRP